MVSADVSRNIVGIIGNVISLFLFLSPVPTFVQICKKGSVEQYSSAPYLATLINCMVWMLYGMPMVHPNSLLVITINGSGTFIELVYIVLFLVYSDKKMRLKVFAILVVEILFMGVLTSLVLTLAHDTKSRSTIVGIVAICFNIMMYAAPLLVMKLVIKTKSVEYMPLSISMASLANGVAWSLYAVIKLDPFILGPNGMGTLFSVAQLVLYGVFCKSTKRIIAERETKGGQIRLSEVVVNGDSKINRPQA